MRTTGPAITPARKRLLEYLKRLEPVRASVIAESLEITDVAARQHLAALEQDGYVTAAPLPISGRGRPAAGWRVTERGSALFPDRHADLTVDIINAAREAVGERGLMRIVEVRARDQANLYHAKLAQCGSLKKRVEALATQRTNEGYMAEVIQERPGCYLLIEHHCPICDAAKACVGLCAAELHVFRQSLGDDVSIERTEYLLAEGNRCVYRIQHAS